MVEDNVVEVTEFGATIFAKLDEMNPSVRAYYLLGWRSRLSLEIAGLRSRQGSAYAYLKKVFGYKGNKQRVLEQYEADLRKMGVLRD